MVQEVAGLGGGLPLSAAVDGSQREASSRLVVVVTAG